MAGPLFDFGFAFGLLPALLRAGVVTVLATLGAFALAAVLGLLLELLRRTGPRWLARAIDFGTRFVRGTPLLVQLFLAYFALPDLGIVLAPLVCGVLVLGLHYACYTLEVYRAGIDAVPRGQWDAARALGFGTRGLYVHVLLGQAVPPMVLPLGNYLVAMFKETPLLAVISVVEMLTVAKLIGGEHFRYIEPLTLAGLLFLAMSLAASAAIQWTDRRLNRRTARRP